MTSLRASLLALSALSLLVAVSACGGGSTTPPDVDAGGATDMSAPVDGNVPDGALPEDAGSDVDASAPDDGGSTDGQVSADMCVSPRCPPIPPGCRVEAPLVPCTCGEIKCDDGGGVPGTGCGGRLGSCAGTLFCDFTVAFDCGFADGTGTCQPRPDVCPSLYSPVCGCDGVTYSNLCMANAGGVDVAADGVCAGPPPPPPPPSDCRTTGCSAGSSCQPCRGIGGATFVCIPDGAVC